MYRPAAFAEDDPAAHRALIAAYPLGTVVTMGPGGLCATPLPFLLEECAEGVRLLAHLPRANPLANTQGEAPALIIFNGPAAYISPGWYPTKAETGRVVPTWNYVTAHAHGHLTIIDDAAFVRRQINALTHQQEARRPQPWALSDAPVDYAETLLTSLVGLSFAVERLEGKWKLSQNQPQRNRQGVIDGLRAEGNTAMAALMTRPDHR